DRVRRAAARRGDRGRALPLAGPGLRDRGARTLHAARARPMKGGGAAAGVGPRRAARQRLGAAATYAVLVTFLLIVPFPFYWMLITSFKDETQMRSLASMFWPRPFVADNYAHLVGKTEFLGWFRNSVVVSVSSTLLATAIGTIGAYALARLKFLGRAFMAS